MCALCSYVTVCFCGSMLSVHWYWISISASQFWRSVEHSCRLWHQTLGPLGTHHTHLQVQQGGPILWDARPYNRHSALWLSYGKAAGGQAFGAVYRDNWSWQGRKAASGKKCYQKWRAVELGPSALEITHCFPFVACVTFPGRIYLCRIYVDPGISPRVYQSLHACSGWGHRPGFEFRGISILLQWSHGVWRETARAFVFPKDCWWRSFCPVSYLILTDTATTLMPF